MFCSFNQSVCFAEQSSFRPFKNAEINLAVLSASKMSRFGLPPDKAARCSFFSMMQRYRCISGKSIGSRLLNASAPN